MLSTNIVYLIIEFMAKNTFIIGPNVTFNEGYIAMRFHFYLVKYYNNVNPNKHRVEFFSPNLGDLFIYWTC